VTGRFKKKIFWERSRAVRTKRDEKMCNSLESEGIGSVPGLALGTELFRELGSGISKGVKRARKRELITGANAGGKLPGKIRMIEEKRYSGYIEA